MWTIRHQKNAKLKFSKSKDTPLQFRATIINLQQIKDLPSIFKSRKAHYDIKQRPITLPSAIDIDQTLYDISQSKRFKEKIALYKQNKYKKKINCINKTQQKSLNPRFELNKEGKIHRLEKIIKQCNESHRFDENNVNTVHQFKQSLNNIFRIRINEKNAYTNQTNLSNNLCFSRSHFISLSNGKPQKESHSLQYPKWIDYAQSKAIKNENKGMNINNIEKRLKELVQKSALVKKIPRRKTYQVQNSRKYSILNHDYQKFISARENFQQKTNDGQQNLQIKQKVPPQPTNQKNKQKERYQKYHTVTTLESHNTEQQSCINAIETIVKSQKYSQKMLNTMADYFKSKIKKKQQFKNNLLCLKSDRKLTLDIRRKNFDIIGPKKLKNLNSYRIESQRERCYLKEQNQRFYLNLLKQMERYKFQEIPLSGQMIQRLRTIINSHYIIDQIHYDMIIEPSLYEQEDPMSSYLIKEIAKLLRRQFN